jgi:mono/diheme cytochrome c family protein
MSLVRWSALVALGLAGCDDVIFQGGGGEVPDGLTGGCAVFAAECTACHAGGQEPDLRPENLPNLVGAVSASYPDKTWIVAGDPEASFVYQKLTGTQGAAGGDMPPTGALDAADLELVAQYITDGAPVCEGTGTGTIGGGLEPGGPVNVGAAPEGFGANVPTWVASEQCSTDQWWQQQGVEEDGPTMHPGNACITCHGQTGGPAFVYAGTVMGGVDDELDCRGVPGVTVELLDTNDDVFATEVTNAAGNFFVRSSDAVFQPFRVRLQWAGRTREMASHVDLTGDCNVCHTPTGVNGAPGRIVAP